MNDEVRKTVDVVLAKPSRSSRFDISQVRCESLISELEELNCSGS